MSTTKKTATPAAILALREAAAALDVEDVVDLCYALEADELRVSIYLEALRGRPGEKAQVAACLLCFDLARRGDERREAELRLLLPTLDDLVARDARGEITVVKALMSSSEAVVALWDELSARARQRDLRADADVVIDAADSDFIDVDLFDADEFAELALDLEDIELALDLDDEVFMAFDAGLNALIPPQPRLLFAADSAEDLERLERLREHCISFHDKLPIAGELLSMTHLFSAVHTRALGLFSRRNRRRDKSLVEGVTRFLTLPLPPSEAIGWFCAGDLPGSDDVAWPKIAELLLELISFVGADVDAHPARYAVADDAAWARGVAEAFVAHPQSARVQPRLTDAADRRRRR